jgi:hypothetical protein
MVPFAKTLSFELIKFAKLQQTTDSSTKRCQIRQSKSDASLGNPFMPDPIVSTPMGRHADRVPLLALFSTFLFVSLCGFGGGLLWGAASPLISVNGLAKRNSPTS